MLSGDTSTHIHQDLDMIIFVFNQSSEALLSNLVHGYFLGDHADRPHSACVGSNYYDVVRKKFREREPYLMKWP